MHRRASSQIIATSLLVASSLFLPLGAMAQCPAPAALEWRVTAERDLPVWLFVQGFEINSEGWWLSSGGYGNSELHFIASEPEQPSQHRKLPPYFFAEGISQRDEQIWMLSWQAGEAWVFDAKTLELKQQHRYRGEGWGLDWEPGRQAFLMSNGSDTLSWREPDDFHLQSRITVRRGSEPVSRLNELEIIGDHALANVWQSDKIVRIRLADGCVDAEIDLRLLWGLRRRPQGADVLNGIAWDADAQQLWVTGKRWGRAFALELELELELELDGKPKP